MINKMATYRLKILNYYANIIEIKTSNAYKSYLIKIFLISFRIS